jgi:hypothetical protein
MRRMPKLVVHGMKIGILVISVASWYREIGTNTTQDVLVMYRRTPIRSTSLLTQIGRDSSRMRLTFKIIYSRSLRYLISANT